MSFDISQIKLIKTLYPKSAGFKSVKSIDLDLYQERKTSKAIVIKEDKIALLKINNNLLMGGGVETGESFEEALVRELKEEAGIEVKIKNVLGRVMCYRDTDENGVYKKYSTVCFVCDYISSSEVSIEGEVTWYPPQEALINLSKQYGELLNQIDKVNTLLNIKSQIYFIKEYISLENYKKKEFDIWNDLKKITARKTDNDIEDFYYSDREVWWCELGINIGHEQDGKGKSYLRPVIVYKKVNKFTFLGIPMSSSLKLGSDRVQVLIKLKEKNDIIKNDALISQIRVFDIRRVRYQLGTVDKEEFAKLKKSMQDFLA